MNENQRYFVDEYLINYRSGLLTTASTRQPGMVVLTDLTPPVLDWLGTPVPSAVVGSPLLDGDQHRSLFGRNWRPMFVGSDKDPRPLVERHRAGLLEAAA